MKKVILCILLSLIFQGCKKSATLDTPVGKIDVPAGSKVTISCTRPGIEKINDIRSGAADLGTSTNTISGKLPSFDLDKFTSVGGTQDAIATYVGPRGGVLIVIGAICLIAAVAVYLFTKNIKITAIIAALGFILIGMGLYPQYALILSIIALGVVGFFVYRTIKAHQTNVVATTVVSEIEKGNTIGPLDLNIPIKDSIATQQIIDATVKLIKTRIMKASEQNGGFVAKFLQKL
jgi:hypothetical protein